MNKLTGEIRRCACFFLLAGLLVVTQRQLAVADIPNLSAAFLQCDSLLGKSITSVQAVLGSPASTNQISPTNASPRFIPWLYFNSDRSGNMSLYFFNGMLVGVNMSQSTLPTMVSFLQICKPASRQYIYREDDAKELAQPNGKTFCQLLINGKSQRGHLLRALCLTSPASPLTYKHILNVTSGLYENKFIQNPNFSVNQVLTVQSMSLSAGTGAVYERDHWTGAEISAYQSRFYEGHIRNLTAYMESVVPSFSSQSVVVAPLTPRNSSWFEKKQTDVAP